ncbi:MAG: hypothetical protein MZU97_01910 [Bacillus subtilis]|nr:hypothetical protein [Bacillus subtilis]
MFKNLFKNLLVIFCCFSILFSYSGSALARQTVRVPSGTTIPIVFKAPVNSDSLQKGDVISIVINQHVKINNRIVFKQGDTGLVYVENVKKIKASWQEQVLLKLEKAKYQMFLAIAIIFNFKCKPKAKAEDQAQFFLA